MAWSIVGSTGTGYADNGSTHNTNLPGTPDIGDIVLVGTGHDSGLPVIQTAGYTNIDAGGTYLLAWKLLTDPVDSLVGISDPNQGKAIAVVVQVIRGVDTNTPFDGVAPTTASGSGMPDAPSITPATALALAVAFGWLDDLDIAGAVTAPSGYSNVIAGQGGVGDGSSSTVMLASKEISGATDPAAFGGGGDDSWNACSFVLRPGGAPPAGISIPVAIHHLRQVGGL